MSERIDLDKPQWDQRVFSGRLRYYAWVTNPRLTLHSTSTLLGARDLLQKYRLGQEPAGTTYSQVRHAQQLYLSAFHPDTGDLQNVIGRMSFYVPGGMLLIGAMITFYRSNSAVIFWQWTNQSFNALVNYTNRNAESDITTKNIGIAYVSATGSALVTSLGLKTYLATRASPMLQRFVPFAAVAAANFVNIPLMRQSELTNGVSVYDENNRKVTESRYAAVKGISQVTFSRILIAAPSMLFLPVLMARLEKQAWLHRYRGVNPLLQVFLAGLTLLVMTPVGCALFSQQCPLPVQRLYSMDRKSQEELEKSYGGPLPKTVFFNKGL